MCSAFPLASVEEAINGTDTMSLGGRQAIEVRGRSVPLIDLAEIVGARAPPRATPKALVVASRAGAWPPCATGSSGSRRWWSRASAAACRCPRLFGAAMTDDGSVALILDPAALTGPFGAGGPSRPQRAKPAPPSKVLVVDDQFTVRELQRSILEAAGYRVETARDGREALDDDDRGGGVDIVVTDVDMPEMTGIELLRAIREDPQRPSLPVVVVSGRGSEEDRRLGLDAGADAYIVKEEFDQRTLLDTVERLIPGEMRRPRLASSSATTPPLRTGAAASSRRDGDFEVVGICSSGEAAVAALPRLSPDLVTMDLEMPGMGGVRAVEQIMRHHPFPILVLSGSAGGAPRWPPRPSRRGRWRRWPRTTCDSSSGGLSAVALRQKLKRLARATVHAPLGPPARAGPGAPPHPPPRQRSASALPPAGRGRSRRCSRAFPRTSLPRCSLSSTWPRVPRWAGALAGQRVPLMSAFPREGQLATPGVWFAPDDAHLRLASRCAVLDADTDVGPTAHRPTCCSRAWPRRSAPAPSASCSREWD